MRQSKFRSNQQETLAYLGGLFDGEGHFGIGRIQKGSNFAYKAEIAFSNTDPLLVNFLTDFLIKRKIAYYIRLRAKSSVGKNQYEISINALSSQKKFLELIIPYLKGLKVAEAELSLKYINNRLKRNDESQPRNPNGTFVRNNKAPFTNEDVGMYKDYKKLKDPQRLHAMPPPSGVKI
jgi:hypothetical protein